MQLSDWFYMCGFKDGDYLLEGMPGAVSESDAPSNVRKICRTSPQTADPLVKLSYC
jgi:hypothetical protein